MIGIGPRLEQAQARDESEESPDLSTGSLSKKESHGRANPSFSLDESGAELSSTAISYGSMSSRESSDCLSECGENSDCPNLSEADIDQNEPSELEESQNLGSAESNTIIGEIPAPSETLHERNEDERDLQVGRANKEVDEQNGNEIEITVKQLLAQGMRLMDLHRNEEDGFEGEDLMDKAVSLFNMAVAEARSAGLAHLEARSLYGLGVAFSECEERKPAAAPLFQLAADLFILTGDSSDAVTSVLNATEVYLQTDSLEDAIDCYQRYDKRVDSGGFFADQLVQLILEQRGKQR